MDGASVGIGPAVTAAEERNAYRGSSGASVERCHSPLASSPIAVSAAPVPIRDSRRAIRWEWRTARS